MTLVVALLAASALLAAGCGGSDSGSDGAAAAGTATTAAAAKPAQRWKVWLCKPGQMPNWCDAEMDVTNVYADGTRKLVRAPAVPKRPVDCFYVYPTVSTEQRGNSDLIAGNEEQGVAVIEASRFGQACRVYAPLYRQTTAYRNVFNGSRKMAYNDVRVAWNDYLAHDNNGRGVVLVGHSQGAGILEQLIRDQIEGDPEVRKRLVSAILLGGSISTQRGSDESNSTEGGSFAELEPCTKTDESGCVVAYNTWGRTPPPDAAGGWIEGTADQFLCVNPARPEGGTVPITPVFPWFAPEGLITSQLRPQVETLWIAFPGKYTARCVVKGKRSWLLIENVGPPGDTRELVSEVLSPDQGLHAADVNIALEQLIDLVRAQSAAWAAGR